MKGGIDMEKVLVIPGSEAQIPLIIKLHDLGYYVICIDPHEHAPAFEYADVCERGDILDKPFCLEVAEKYNIVAALSDECDIAMPIVAYVSDQLGLPGISMDMASMYTNKYRMRCFCKFNNMPYPQYKQCKSVNDAIDFFEQLDKKKMIMKPLDSNSSRGVYTIVSQNMIRKYFDQTCSFSKIEKAVLCEEYVEGEEFTVDGIVLGVKHYSLIISKKKHYQYNTNIAYELYFSYRDSMYDYEKLRKQNDLYVEKTGLPFGLTHAEYKFNGKDFVLIEIGARGGGNFISSHILPALCDIDIYRLLINSILKHETEEITIDNASKSKCAVLKFWDVPCDKGKVIYIEGLEELKKMPQVLLFKFRFEIGDVICRANNDSARVGFYIAVCNSRSELDETIDYIDKTVKIGMEV